VAHETAKPKTAKHVTHLPLLAVSPTDINRLNRELVSIEDALLELRVRKGGQTAKLPKTTQLMDQLIELNKLNLLHETDRSLLKQFLQAVKQRAPVMHVSFSADPSTNFLEKLITWLRREIHPQVLLTIGLQPTLGAGCIVRTANHQFDFSLRQDFAKKRNLLIGKLTPEAKRQAS
jgi:F0F1-type ATP synthase delta subunit